MKIKQALGDNIFIEHAALCEMTFDAVRKELQDIVVDNDTVREALTNAAGDLYLKGQGGRWFRPVLQVEFQEVTEEIWLDAVAELLGDACQEPVGIDDDRLGGQQECGHEATRHVHDDSDDWYRCQRCWNESQRLSARAQTLREERMKCHTSTSL